MPNEPVSQEQTSENNAEPKWWLDEKTPGIGDRPEWLPEKFKTAADISKSYTALEKKLGSAPSEYDLSKGDIWIEKEDPLVTDLVGFAKESNVSQEFMDRMLSNIGAMVTKDMVDESKEIEKLGENGKERVEIVNNWLESNVSKEAATALTDAVFTADGFRALEEIRNMVNKGKSIVPNNEQVSGTPSTTASIAEEIKRNFDKYQEDSDYREAIKARMAKAAELEKGQS